MPIMLTRLLAAGLLLLFLAPLSAQNPTFQQLLSDSSDTRSYSVTPLPDGYIIAGSTSYGNSASSDGFLIRTDLNGDIIWQQRYDSYGSDELRAVCPANGGGFLAVGAASGAGVGTTNAWLVRVDDNGNQLWNKTIGQSGTLTFATDVTPIDGGYIVTGDRINNTIATARGFVARIDNDGTSVWTKIPFSNRYNSIDDNFVHDGVIYGCGNGYSEVFGERVQGFWFSMDLETGNLIKSFRYFSQEWEVVNNIALADDGNLVMSGWSQPYSLLITQPSYAWAQKVTPDGEVIWSKTYHVPTWTHHWSRLVKDNDGGYTMMLYLNFRVQDNSQTFDENAALVKLDADGDLLWNRRFTGGTYSHFNNFEKAPDGGYVAVGGVKNTSLTDYASFFVKTDFAGNMTDCCSSRFPVIEYEDLIDTVMVFDPAPANFSETRNEPEPMVGPAYFVATDICAFSPVYIEGTIQFCPGKSVTLGGVTYDQPDTVEVALPNADGCDTLATYVLEWLPTPTLSDTIRFCPGATVSLQGETYSMPGVISVTLPGSGDDCDTLATYVLEWLPQPTLSDTIYFCPGSTVSLQGESYSQPGLLYLTLPGSGDDCDTLATYLLEWLPQASLSKIIHFCPGSTVSLLGNTYSQPGVVNVTLPGSGDDCDTLATYVLQWLPQVTLSDTIRFCPGETVSVHGIEYTQPGEISLVLPGSGDECDTLATYVLEYSSDNQPNTISLTCPANLSVIAAPGSTIANVSYDQPLADTDCPCPGLSTTLVSGGASGTAFPLGVSTVCYRADDACGHSATCCFTVSVQSVEDACDTKFTGCIKFELLGVQRDGAQNWIYRVRVTNNCSTDLQYVYLQVPDGLTAFSPANNAIYTAPSGRTYLARNPNYSPMYSVRFKTQDAVGIAGGQSDVFRYALPQQADVDYINVGVRLSSGTYYETHLNTFGCPVTTELNPRPAAERQNTQADSAWRVYPNPAAPGALLHLEGPALDNAVFALRDAAGRLVWEGPVTDQTVSLGTTALPAGVYGYRILSNGQWAASGKLVVLR